MILFHADTDKLELLYILRSLESGNLLDKILVICSQNFAKEYNPNIPNLIIDDFSDMQVLVTRIKDWMNEKIVSLDWIVPSDDDEGFLVTRALSEGLGIPTYPKPTLLASSNKFVMKKCFEKNNVPICNYKLINSPEDAKLFSFPNVMKMIVGGQSVLMFKNETYFDLEKNFSVAISEIKRQGLKSNISEWSGISLDAGKQMLVEEFMAGEEFSCDFVVLDGQITVLRVIHKIPSAETGYFLAYHLMNNSSIDKFFKIEKLKSICKNIADSFSLNAGVCMVDFMLVGKEILVIESSVRPGFSTFLYIMLDLYGYTSWKILMGLLLGEKSLPEIPDIEGLIYYIWAPASGTITKFDCLISSEIELMKFIQFDKVGDSIIDSPDHHYNRNLGLILIRNPKDIYSTIDRINKSIIIEMK
ncbi:MAG: ATP-grasp domain-containing protein [archaeon]